SQQLPPRPSPAVAYQRLDSLEQAALTGTTFAPRLHAASTITSIARGQGSCVSGPNQSAVVYPGLVRRLASIYRRSADASLRRSILNLMLFQVECDEYRKSALRAAASWSVMSVVRLSPVLLRSWWPSVRTANQPCGICMTKAV